MITKFEARLIAKFPGAVVRRGESVYARSSACNEIVRECDLHEVLILGIEVFEIVADGITPRTDLILDNSIGKNSVNEMDIGTCNSSAERFIDLLPKQPNLLVNFTFDDD